ncbi:phosphoglycerate kinase [Corticibacter populi]|uniref:Phosphoglycerate kinase n=1 Tax=Corticibacter populi TaxID=1550736 RepID=A0A3M6R048_9BURK|nr:histidine phosphatase family protein [Corticibacter populi]RMX08647.1 phosphoglycerate kinase [Corticibacter populi]RZS35979.1 alpha-ribazole phosphatase [Corticibacter populi]
MPLWIMRHPRVVQAEPTCYGASEVPLDTAHLQTCAEALAAALPQGSRITTSQRQRTQALATALAALRPDLADWQTDARLNEMDFGCWELVPWRQIPKPAIDAWTADFASHRFGGRESVTDIIGRAAAMLDDHRRIADTDDAPRLWITHAGVLNALALLQERPDGRIRSAADWPPTRVGFGQWLIYPDRGTHEPRKSKT